MSGYTLPKVSARLQLSERGGVCSSDPIKNGYDFLCLLAQEMLGSPVEKVIGIFLDISHRPISYADLSLGGVSRCTITASYMLQTALLSNASKILLSHYHPNSDPSPSVQDWQLTEELADACAVCGLSLIDHVILSADSVDPSKPNYASMRQLDSEHRIWKTPIPDDFYTKPAEKSEEDPAGGDLDVYGHP